MVGELSLTASCGRSAARSRSPRAPAATACRGCSSRAPWPPRPRSCRSCAVLGAGHVEEAVAFLRGEAEPPAPAARRRRAARRPRSWTSPTSAATTALIPALEVAAAGGHNLYLHGPPGTGKTMLARRLPSILPPLIAAEAIEVTRIQSVGGLHHGGGLAAARPFRAPHHTISASGLVGGGAQPTPGEATLAHHGVLFLDELSEFARPSLEALRQPLEDGHVTIVRGQRVMAFPTASCSSRPRTRARAGWATRTAHCSAGRPRAPPPAAVRPAAGPDRRPGRRRPPGRRGAARRAGAVLGRGARARGRRARAPGRPARPHGLACNAQMSARLLREHASATPSALRLLYELHDRHRLSARGHGRVLRVARTVADLDDSDASAPSTSPSPPASASRRPPWPRRHDGRRAGRLPAPRRSARTRHAGACDACLRRTALIAALSGCLDVEWRRRDAAARVLALPDEELLALGTRGRRGGTAVRRRAARAVAARAGVALVCRCAGLPGAAARAARPARGAARARGSRGARRGGRGRDRRRPARDGYGLEVARALGRGLSPPAFRWSPGSRSASTPPRTGARWMAWGGRSRCWRRRPTWPTRSATA